MIIHDLRHKTEYTITELLQYLNMNVSTYYYVSKKNEIIKYEKIKSEILNIYHKHKGRYGYRRILIALKQLGYKINHKTVYKLMKDLNILGIRSKKGKKYNSYKGTVGKVASNIINRNFKAEHPYEKMFTDVTEFKINDEKIYLSPIIDAYNGEVLAYSVSMHGDLELVLNTIDNLYQVLPRTLYPQYIHSDQGFQYQHEKYVKKLEKHNIVQSMSRKGNCLDNCIAEGFFGKLKTEFYYQEQFENVQDFINKLNDYIYYYNNERIKTALSMSPIQYRLLNAA